MKRIKTKLLLLSVLTVAILFGLQQKISAQDDKPKPSAAKQSSQKVEKPKAPAPEIKQKLPITENKPDQNKTKKQSDDNEQIDDLEINAETAELYEKCNHIFSTYVGKDGNVDYLKLRRKRSELADAVRSIQKITPLQYMAWDEITKKTFWINTHNIFTLKLVIDNYPIEPVWYLINFPKNSIKHINGGRGREKVYFDIIDLEHTIREMEFDLLLKKFNDVRVIFALSYGSRSSAFLRNEVYRPETLDKQLDDQVRRFLASGRGMEIKVDTKTVALSGIFTWYREFFLKSDYADIKKFREYPAHTRAYLNFIIKYAPEKDVKFLNSSEFTAKKTLPYNWELNEKQRK